MPLDRKIGYIDLSTGKIEKMPIPPEIRKKFLGGRGLDAYLLYNHMGQGVDSLGPKNTLIMSGDFAMTWVRAVADAHVAVRSPPLIRRVLSGPSGSHPFLVWLYKR